jgi:hypothetical protein
MAKPKGEVASQCVNGPETGKKMMTIKEKLEHARKALASLRHQLSVIRPFSEIPASNALVNQINEALEITDFVDEEED